MVERQLPKLNVAGSIPVSRSIYPVHLYINTFVRGVPHYSRHADHTISVLICPQGARWPFDTNRELLMAT